MGYETTKHNFTDSNGKSISVQISSLGAFKGIAILTKIKDIILPFLPLISIVKKDGLKADIPSDVLGTVVNLLSEKMGEEQTIELVKSLMEGVIVDGKHVNDQDTFNLVFSREYSLLFAIIRKILEVNFSSFFVGNGIGSLLKGLKIPKTQDIN